MASLRRITGSRYWIACITRASGVRTNISTKTTDRSLARKIAERYQEIEDKARSGTLVAAQVKKVFNEVLDRLGEEQIDTETVENFLHEWSKNKSNPRTAERYAHAADLFLESLGKRSKVLLGSISHLDVLTFIKVRQNQNAAPNTIIVDVKCLGTAFNLARKLGYLQSNPFEKALALCPIEVTSSEKDCFSPEQVSKLLQTATGDWKTTILLAYYTGARLGDCSNMTRANLNLKEGVIDYAPQKGRKRRQRVIVPMHPELRAHLEAMDTGANGDSLCPTLAGRESGGQGGLSQGFRRLMEQAGVDSQTVAGKGNRRFSKLSFHSLRHSFNSILANRGVDQETRMKLTGHSSVAINNDYTHLELPKLRAAVERLPRLSGDSSPSAPFAQPATFPGNETGDSYAGDSVSPA